MDGEETLASCSAPHCPKRRDVGAELNARLVSLRLPVGMTVPEALLRRYSWIALLGAIVRTQVYLILEAWIFAVGLLNVAKQESERHLAVRGSLALFSLFKIQDRSPSLCPIFVRGGRYPPLLQSCQRAAARIIVLDLLKSTLVSYRYDHSQHVP